MTLQLPIRSRLPEPARRVLRHIALAYHRRRIALGSQRRQTERAVVRRYHGTRYGRSYATTLAHVRTRDQLPLLLNRRGLLGTAVEIGVQRGRFSEFLLRGWKGSKLISVDPWREAAAGEYVDRANVAQLEQDRRYAETLARLRPFGTRSEVWRTTSTEAAERVDAGTLDFVYVDARHDFDSVLEDLEAWWPKVRPGGLIAGHDYVDGDLPNGLFGVKSAVDTFFGRLGLPVHSTDGAPRTVEIFPTWIVEVPD